MGVGKPPLSAAGDEAPMHLAPEDFARVVLLTPLVSIDFLMRNAGGGMPVG